MSSSADLRRSSISQVASLDIEAPPAPFDSSQAKAPMGMTSVRAWQWLALRALAVLLATAVIALSVALAVTLSADSSNPTAVSSTTPSAVAAECQDFNAFVCPSYLAQNAGLSSFSLLEASDDRLWSSLLSSLASAPHFAVYSGFLQSCLNDHTTGADAVSTLQPWFAAIDANVTSLASYMDMLGQLRSTTGAAVLLELTVQQVAGRAGMLLISQGGLSMSEAWYDWTYEYEHLLSSVSSFFALTTNDSSAALDLAVRVTEFEYAISLITEAGGVAVTVSLDALLDDTELLLAELMRGAGINVTGGSQAQPYAVRVAPASFFYQLPSLLLNTSLLTLQAHAKWRTYSWLSNSLGGHRPAIDYDFANVQTPSISTCLATANRWVGDVLTAGYVDAILPPGTRQVVLDMQSQLRSQWATFFRQQLWMDDVTRQASLNKLGNITLELGGGTVQPGYDSVNVSASNSFLQNVLAVAALTSRNQWLSLQDPAIRTPSFQASALVAQYLPYFNTIQVSAYLLQSPVFNVSQSTLLNWARLGSIMGHEIGHAFDSPSEGFEPSFGSWSAASVDAFTAASQCLVQQYDNTSYTLNLTRWGADFGDFPIIDAHIKGSMTLGENIADYGGVHAAYSAYRASMGSAATAADDRQFFVGYAQLLCRQMDDYGLWTALKTDPHAPSHARINNVLSMFKPFASAYSCPIGSPMNPAQQCSLYN